MKKYIYVLFLLIIALSLYFYESIVMLRMEFLENDNLPTGTIYLVIMLILSVITSLFLRGRIIRDNVVQKFFILLIWIYIISLFYSSNYNFSRANYFLIILPLFLLFFTSSYVIFIKNDNLIVWTMTLVALSLSVLFFVNMTDMIAEKRTSGSYYIIFFLPFFLCHNKIVVRNICIIITFIVSILSLKLGGTLCVFLGMVVYVLIKQMGLNTKRYGFKSVFIVIALILLFVYFALYLNDNMLEGMLLDHLDESSSTGGSGRLILYGKYVDMIWNSSFSYILFGRGWEGSINSSNFGMTCHNDFLESFVDFGLVGFIMYIAFHIALFSKCRMMIKQKSQYAPAMGASVAMFFINSMVSHILICPWFLMIFALFWGFVIFRQRKEHLSAVKTHENWTFNISRGV